MEIKESGDERIYTSVSGIPTIQLGSGGTIISVLNSEKKDKAIAAGVGFILGVGEIGELHPEVDHKLDSENGTF